MAVLPAHRGGIAFAPALPPEYEKLAEHWPQGRLSKAYAAYETPFWRKNGCSGEALSDEGPVFITFDVSPGDAGPGILLGFTGARTFDPLPAEQLREQALEGFVTLFGDAAVCKRCQQRLDQSIRVGGFGKSFAQGKFAALDFRPG